MVSDELIGIAGVFVFTFCLIALYHFIGLFGRHKDAHGVHLTPIGESRQDLIADHDMNKFLGNDDAWLLWNPDLDVQGGPPNPGFGEQRSEGR